MYMSEACRPKPMTGSNGHVRVSEEAEDLLLYEKKVSGIGLKHTMSTTML
jgi:hypothetical protein